MDIEVDGVPFTVSKVTLDGLWCSRFAFGRLALWTNGSMPQASCISQYHCRRLTSQRIPASIRKHSSWSTRKLRTGAQTCDEQFMSGIVG